MVHDCILNEIIRNPFLFSTDSDHSWLLLHIVAARLFEELNILF